MQFKEIIGQEKLKSKMIKMIENNRLGHALLFSGKYGYGSLASALSLCQYIFCTDKQESDACGKCPSCLKVEKLQHPDLHFSYPVNKSDRSKLGVSEDYLDSWRELVLESSYFDLQKWNEFIGTDKKQSLINVEESKQIIKKLSLKSYEAGYKVLIIWSADKMNGEAANRLLKMIEEPADKTLIILLSEDEEKIIQTILSRTQIVRFTPIDATALCSHLMQQYDIDQGRSMAVAKISEGDLIKASSLIDRKDEEDVFFQLFAEWMRACYEANVERIYKWVEDMSSASYGREKQKRFLEYALNLMREGILRNFNGSDLQSFFGKEDQFMQKFSPFIIAENIVEINELLNEAHYHIERNAYAKIIFMDMSMQFANLLRAKKRKFVS